MRVSPGGQLPALFPRLFPFPPRPPPLPSPSTPPSSKPVPAPGGRTTTQRLGRPSFVRDGESSASSKPSVPTKKSMAGS